MKIPAEAISHFELGIYLPILLIILEKDRATMQQVNFKFTSPYLHIVDQTKLRIESELENTKAYFHRHKMRLTRGKKDELFTEYHFRYDELVECRRYSNIRLRNHSEMLLMRYLESH